ncbi:hypothetical protein [Phaeobacter gallaeciensis]|uniref:Uncharacterized protein n=1 Tax=Phaeobacter gallaeciensis TaxID=60890 RepID=A0AAC9Z5M5_9RHOB|nr:hypothetical protein [Phaeobacter gallaeciensis]AHD07877.1 hypothetical protein Gal_00074 [Phaeobacter gallaeciensis DSM 26640]ATE91145.1 hypothetical protein PhaeoP11_00073 [Phaeobacter gallaeciensis]ATE95420.1 hypothetical protein PhaeoP73_00073 [Phaeobacter gallaeciensis]ATE99759.1 hypothetical protein PhaeoP75_00073 [Phaeobacter gallaeciensis]ATF04192.1 hypothetical protein PhaeoP63_00073 [Phaeobacter gallaeciensis]
MSQLTLTKIRFRDGLWEGRIGDTGSSGSTPVIEVRHLDRLVPDVALEESETAGEWSLTIPIPTEAIADGVQSFVIYDLTTDAKLGDFTLICGELTGDDLRVEVELLRAELDMLKRAFRRHCVETQ